MSRRHRALRSRQSGGVLIGAIVLLVLASVLAAGVATLVSQSALGTASRLDSERALFALESGRLAVQAGVGCSGQRVALEIGGYQCIEDACDRAGRGDDVMIGWSDGPTPDDAQATQQICFLADGGGNYDPEDFEHFEEGGTNEDIDYQDSSVAFGGGDDDSYAFGGNTQATFTNSDAVFLGPTTLRGNITFTASGTGPLEIGVVFTDDVTFAGNTSVTFDDTFVCFGGGVFANGNPDIMIQGGEVRYTQGDPGFINHQDTTVITGGDCDAGDGSNWDYGS